MSKKPLDIFRDKTGQEWCKFLSKTRNQYYWFNPLTKESSWTKPERKMRNENVQNSDNYAPKSEKSLSSPNTGNNNQKSDDALLQEFTNLSLNQKGHSNSASHPHQIDEKKNIENQNSNVKLNQNIKSSTRNENFQQTNHFHSSQHVKPSLQPQRSSQKNSQYQKSFQHQQENSQYQQKFQQNNQQEKFFQQNNHQNQNSSHKICNSSRNNPEVLIKVPIKKVTEPVVLQQYDPNAKFKEILKTLSLNELLTLKIQVKLQLENAVLQKSKSVDILTKKVNNVQYYIDNIYYQMNLQNSSGKGKKKSQKTSIFQNEEDLQLFYAKLQNQKIKEYEKIKENEIGLTVNLLSHQQYGVSWMFACESSQFKGGIFADDMGLGKTLTALSLIQLDLFKNQKKEQENSSNLIICPNSLLSQWENEIFSKFEKKIFKIFIYHGTDRFQKIKFLPNLVVLTTPGIVVSEVQKKDSILKHNWRRIILDEGHLISNYKTKIFKSLLNLSSEFKWIISGTPVQNSLEDLAAYFSFLKIHPWTEPEKFKKILKSENPVSILSEILPKIFLRRTKGSVDPKTLKKLVELPERKIILKELDFQTEIEKEIYQILHKNCREWTTRISQTSNDNSIIALTMRLRLLQACSDPLLLIPKEERNYQNFQEDLQKIKQKYLHYFNDFEKQKKKVTPTIDLLSDSLNNLSLNNNLCLNNIQNQNSQNQTIQCNICLEIAESKIELDCCQNFFCKECLLSDSKNRDSDFCPCGKTNLDHFFENQEEENEKTEKTNTGWMSSKVQALISNLQNLPKNDKCLVYSQWTSMLDSISYALNYLKIPYARLDGALSTQKKQEQIQKFKTETKIKIFLVSLKSGNVGLNLIEANHVFMMDLWWNPQVEEQAYDRVYRIGQKKEVFIYRFFIKNTWERNVLIKQEEKKHVVSELFSQTNFKSQADPIFKFKLDDFL